VWNGPVFEPFLRHYFSKEDHSEGFFVQGKYLHGFLSTDQLSLSGETQKGSSYGFGVGAGYKFNIGNRFFIEPLIGYRQLSYPNVNIVPSEPTNIDPYELLFGLFKLSHWTYATGSRLDFQFKLGYAF
jgi:outer membrane autotransporter protein